MITHVLDTSALLAHYFGEEGADEVDALWSDPSNEIAISVVSCVELWGRLIQSVPDRTEVERAFDAYTRELSSPRAVDARAAAAAIELREASAARLPLVDALIAGCARCHDAVLVHRDPHMDAIPDHLVRKLRLPERTS